MKRAPQRGMTLVELLVAMVIGLGVTLAVSTLLVAGENHKRTTTSTNDAEQTGAYAFYALDRALRGAGSALAESAFPTDVGVLSCRLNAGTFLPRASAFPAPFATAFLSGATSTLRVAPLLIGKNQSDNTASDVLVVMGGSGAAGGVSRAINGSGSATSLILENAVGFSQYDLALVSQSGTTDCLLEEVSSVSAPTLALNTTYPYYTVGTTTTLATLASNTASYVTPVGNAAANNVQFQLFGVGTNDTLYSYDLLQNQLHVQGTGADTSQAIADGVVQMNAIYGLQVAATPGILSTWAGPGDVGYDINTVMTTPATMESIIAVRVALVVRGEYYDKNPVSPATLTIFSGYTNAGGTSLSKNIVLSATAQHYRYRVFEFTVPLRNMLLLAGA
jgi:type IV pilus assembly protein PilW